MRFDYRKTPILIVCRDKISPLIQLVEWLETHEYERIVLVDNASSYPPLLEYLARTPHDVVRHSQNLGPWASIWCTDVRDKFARDNYFVVTDCDVVPDPECPGDAVNFFHWALCRHPSFVKAGFGLRIDNLPEWNDLAANVRQQEYWFWVKRFSLNLYAAPIDTTFALYRPGAAFAARPAIRTGTPYVARHQPWYLDRKNRSEEDLYYRDHCDPQIAHWDVADVEEGHVPPKSRGGSVVMAKLRWRAHVLFGLQRDRSVPRLYRPAVH